MFGFGLPIYFYPSKFQSPILGRLVIQSSQERHQMFLEVANLWPSVGTSPPNNSSTKIERKYLLCIFVPLINSCRSRMRYVACCFLGGAWDPKENIPAMRNSHPSNPSELEDFPGHLLSPDPPDAAKVATWESKDWFHWICSVVDVYHTKCVILYAIFVLLKYVYRQIRSEGGHIIAWKRCGSYELWLTHDPPKKTRWH